MDQKLQWAIAKVLDIVKPDFHGGITLHFQAGKLQYIRRENTEKPPEN